MTFLGGGTSWHGGSLQAHIMVNELSQDEILFYHDKWLPQFTCSSKERVETRETSISISFFLAMEYLTRLLKTLRSTPAFNYHPRCHKQQIIQLSFVDDILLFSREDIPSTTVLYECFQQFSNVFGLIANQAKSSVYFGGISEAINI